MHKESSPRVLAAICLAGLLAAYSGATPCSGSDRVSADPTITLSFQNEPLRSVLGKISKTTGWKIRAPEKWMDKQVTQTLTEVPLERGLRYILKDAGVENLLVTYDEAMKLVTVFDTETAQGRLAGRPEAPMNVPPPVVSAPAPTPGPSPADPILSRPPRDPGSASQRGMTRAQRRRAMSPAEE
jgi:hypothetical protein